MMNICQSQSDVVEWALNALTKLNIPGIPHILALRYLMQNILYRRASLI